MTINGEKTVTDDDGNGDGGDVIQMREKLRESQQLCKCVCKQLKVKLSERESQAKSAVNQLAQRVSGFPDCGTENRISYSFPLSFCHFVLHLLDFGGHDFRWWWWLEMACRVE